MFEYQIEAEMEKTFYDLGAERLGYPQLLHLEITLAFFITQQTGKK